MTLLGLFLLFLPVPSHFVVFTKGNTNESPATISAQGVHFITLLQSALVKK
jgi:hypothetical protein